MSSRKYVYINELSIDPLLKCKICSQPFIDPVITRDGNRFCRSCIIQRFQLENPSANNQQSSTFISELVPVRETILLGILGDISVRCIQCQKPDIRRIQIEQHLTNECPKRMVLCLAADLKCPWTGTSEERNDHMQQCIFQPFRPMLKETLNCQKQLEQYQGYFNEQKNEIARLQEQVEQSKIQTEKLQKGFKAVLDVGGQQRLRYDTLQKHFQEIREQWNEQFAQRDELRQELQQLKEQYSQLHGHYDGFQLELHRLNELQQITNQDNRLEKKMEHFEKQYQEDMLALNTDQHQTKSIDEYQLDIKQLREHEDQIQQLKKQEQYRMQEALRTRQICDRHEIQISLLARKKSIAPVINTSNDTKIGTSVQMLTSGSEIYIDGKQLTNEDIHFICNKFIVTNHCQKLRLEKSDITAQGVTIIADALHGNIGLVELSLANNLVSDMGVHSLAQALVTNNSTLESLRLDSTSITDDSAEYLADMLKVNKTITYLGLSSNQISDRGVRLLANAIAYYNETLEYLYLSLNKFITDASIDDIIEMLNYNRSLTVVSVTDCNMSPSAVEKLRKVTQSKANFILKI